MPIGCLLTGNGTRHFTSTACDNTVCDQCTEDMSGICCCLVQSLSSIEVMCEGESPCTFTQPDQCSCQSCDNVVVQLVFQVISSSNGEILGDAQLTITDSTSSSLTIDSAGFFSTFRQVSIGTVAITASAIGHVSRVFQITILPPGPLLFTVTLSAVIE